LLTFLSIVVRQSIVTGTARAELLAGTSAAPLHYFTMSERAQAYRRKANECELAARLASDVEVRVMYRDLAQMWQEMASELEQFEAFKQAAAR